jgi:endonuclease YncB( thermonuclease family)
VRYRHIAIIVFLILIFSFSSYNYFVTSYEGLPTEARVEEVIDGDTVKITGGYLVRYVGINAPEIRRKEGDRWIYNPQPFAEEAKAFNKKLVEGKKVRLKYDVVKRDTFDRLLAYVYLGDRLVNGEMISRGYALTYIYPPNVNHADLLVRLQNDARENDRGLWCAVNSHPITPDKASEYIGKIKTVEGRVRDIYKGERVIRLNLGGVHRPLFHVVIFRNVLNRFESRGISSLNYYRGKKVRTRGLIKDSEGLAEMVIDDPSQIEVLE